MLYFFVTWVVKYDHHRNPNSNDRDHLVGQLTKGQRPFGTFLKIHPFLKGQASLTVARFEPFMLEIIVQRMHCYSHNAQFLYFLVCLETLWYFLVLLPPFFLTSSCCTVLRSAAPNSATPNIILQSNLKKVKKGHF